MMVMRILRQGLQKQHRVLYYEKQSMTRRTHKNFGHKRQPIPLVTTLWHGFLTFSFIGIGIEWKRIAKFLLGDVDLDKNQVEGYKEPEGNFTDL